jgi:23S rRNA (cytosine1962-C5)-methyltransferase
LDPATPIRLRRRGVERWRGGHPWIYAGDVEAVPAGVPAGALARVAGPGGPPFGVAAYSDRSKIRLRGTPIPPSVDDPDAAWLDLVAAAVARRGDRAAVARVVHADADGTPGLIADRYGPWLSIQTLTQTAARLEEPTIERLLAATGCEHVVLRNAARARDHEGLPREDRIARGPAPAEATVELHGVRMTFDLLAGQKTGAFLDQVENWARLGRLARGDALDAFCYEGGFALQLARGGADVTALDSSATALERLQRNARLNGLDVRTECVNVFDRLRELEREARRFDVIVLDPPAFVKSRRDLAAGQRAYKELNLRALKLLLPGGHLLTCSCSANLDRAAFEQTVRAAAADARRWVRLLERRGAPPDHPVLLGAPETDYLKLLLLQAE